MDPHLEDLRAIVDREKIRDCLSRVARGEDRRDPVMLKGCFWPDSGVDLGIFIGSFDEYLAWVTPGAPNIPVTLHTLGQTVFDLRDDKAAVETHVTSYHRIDFGEEHRDVVLGGRYLDRMEQRDGEWRIAHRTMLYDWQQDFGVSVDWSKGLMGMPFLTTHSVGSANGDHSETFFR